MIVAFPGHIHFNFCCSLTFARCRALFVLCLVVADGSCLAPYSPLWGKGISLLRFLLIESSSWGNGQAMFYDYVTSVLILEKVSVAAVGGGGGGGGANAPLFWGMVRVLMCEGLPVSILY